MTRTLTFVPGTMCTQAVWQPVWDKLGDGLVSDYLAIERSETADAFRQTFLAAAEHAPLNLVAFSMGGYLALEFAITHPDKVSSLITVSSSAYGLHAAEKKQRHSAIQYLKTHRYTGIADARLKQMLHATRHRDEPIKQIMRDMDEELGVETLITQLTVTSERENLMDRLPEITCPSLILGGDEDPFLTLPQKQAMTDAIPNARTDTAPVCGHMVPLERADWLAAQISSFHSSFE